MKNKTMAEPEATIKEPAMPRRPPLTQRTAPRAPARMREPDAVPDVDAADGAAGRKWPAAVVTRGLEAAMRVGVNKAADELRRDGLLIAASTLSRWLRDPRLAAEKGAIRGALDLEWRDLRGDLARRAASSGEQVLEHCLAVLADAGADARAHADARRDLLRLVEVGERVRAIGLRLDAEPEPMSLEAIDAQLRTMVVDEAGVMNGFLRERLRDGDEELRAVLVEIVATPATISSGRGA